MMTRFVQYPGNDSNQDVLFHSEKSHNTTKISSPDSSVSDNQHRVNQISNIVHIKLNHQRQKKELQLRKISSVVEIELQKVIKSDNMICFSIKINIVQQHQTEMTSR